MATPAVRYSLEAIVRVCQIIAAALIFGPLPILAVSHFIGPLRRRLRTLRARGHPTWSVGSSIIWRSPLAHWRSACLSSSRDSSLRPAARPWCRAVERRSQAPCPGGAKLETVDEARASLLLAFQTQFIVGAAIIEGAAFFAATAYLLYGHPIALGVAIVMIGVSLARFPTRARTEHWIEQQQEKLRDEGFAPR